MASSTARHKKLKKELAALQTLADNQKHHYVSSKALLYEGISRVYLWWQEANKEKGLLEKLYDEYDIQYKQTIHEIQFTPLLRYLWNMDSAMNSNTLDQWNRALNKIHTEVQTNKPYYKNNAQNKIITLISSKGGITELAGYFESTSTNKNAPSKKLSKKAAQRLEDTHLTSGKNYFAGSTPIANIKTPKLLTSVDKGLALALIRKTNSGYEVLSAVDDERLVEQAIIKAYTRTSKQMPHTVRLITEIIRSQTLPTKIGKLAPSLADKSKYKHDETKQVMKQLKRLLYIGKKGEFVLSANRSDCSVVTVASPFNSIFKKKEKDDLALAVNDRTFIENNLIHTDDFNLYTTDAKRLVSETTSEEASHKMKLENTATRHFRFIRFYRLSSYNFPPSKLQAIVRPSLVFKPKYRAVLDSKWIDDMNFKFLLCWVDGLGAKMKRAEHSVMKLTLGKTGIAISFNYKAKKFEETEMISFSKKYANKHPINVKLLSRDIVPVLNALVTMEIEGNVKIAADDKILRFEFATECAEYSISIPCCNDKAKRMDDYFEAYGD